MRHTFHLPMTMALAVAALTACGDDVTDPEALLESAEAEAVMRSARDLPLLPDLMTGVDSGGDRAHATLLRARELWDEGSTDAPRAAARRQLAVRHALPILMERLPEEEWVEVRDRTDDWIATANAMLRHLSIPEVEERLDAADRLLRRSDAALTDRTRLYYLLLAGSELVETTPRFVARVMARRAEAAVAGSGDREEPLSARTLERAERLSNWSARALEEGDYLLAVQRAYYALQLVEEP